MISSTGNTQVKHVISLIKKSKTRKEEGLFVVEGIRMFTELPKEQILKAYVSHSFLQQQQHYKLLKDIDFEEVSDDVFKAMSDTQTPQGILALVRQYQYSLEDLMHAPGFVHIMALESIQDPGNLGTILRAGEGAGITGVLMDNRTVDIYNPKVIRSTMGSVFRVPFFYAENFREAICCLKQKKIAFYAADLSGENNYEEEDYTGNIGFLIGNEASGLSDETVRLADKRIKIPMSGQVESLNAAIAASILMFEVSRQRRQP